MALGDDDDDAVARQPRAGRIHQADGDVVRQRRRAPRIEAQLHGGPKACLTFCPPGPEARTKLSSSSASSTLICLVTRIMAERHSAGEMREHVVKRAHGVGPMTGSADEAIQGLKTLDCCVICLSQ